MVINKSVKKHIDTAKVMDYNSVNILNGTGGKWNFGKHFRE